MTASIALVDRLQRALGQNDRARIVQAIEELVLRQTPLGAQWHQLAHIAAEHGELSLSRNAMELHVRGSGNDPLTRYQQAGLLAQGGALEEAYAVMNALPEDMPDPAVNAYSRGAAAVFLGKASEARDLLESAAALRPELGQVWLPLSTLIDFSDEPEMVDRILAAGRVLAHAPPGASAMYRFALGKAYVDIGEHALAFAAFSEGCEMKKRERAYDRNHDRSHAAEAVRGYDADSMAAISRQQKEATARPIFVFGMPRSGTTLVEQILTSHSAVSDGGEINRLRMLAREVGGPAYPPLAGHVAAHGIASLTHLWNHWLRERFPAPGRIVDKSIDTSRFLGLAASLFPEAPLVWLTRDPLDCAWSCFRTHFLAGVEWSYDLQDIAFHLRLEEQLHSQWQDVLGDRLLTVPYESLVSDSESWIRRILDHCGLAEEAPVFVPHDNTRSVTTSSVMQVRRPINQKAVGAAQPYRAFLEPFLEAYGK